MGTNPLPERELLPSGKTIRRLFDSDGSLAEEMHCYGAIDISIGLKFHKGSKVEETYLVKSRLVGRRSYEKARANYSDMPPADISIEDWGKDLLRDLRAQQKQRKLETERRLTESQESRFPRPQSANWLRIITKEKAHLVEFSSRDWKILARERSIPSGREWLAVFGFNGPPDSTASVAKGLEIGYDFPGDTKAMLEVSRLLLGEVVAFASNPPKVSYWHGSIRPRPKPRPKPALIWPSVLPPIIEFLSSLQASQVTIYNHCR
jgi:hypothetical protein